MLISGLVMPRFERGYTPSSANNDGLTVDEIRGSTSHWPIWFEIYDDSRSWSPSRTGSGRNGDGFITVDRGDVLGSSKVVFTPALFLDRRAMGY
jgi:hypothetical protein